METQFVIAKENHTIDEVLNAERVGKTLEPDRRTWLVIELLPDGHLTWTAHNLDLRACPEVLARALTSCFDDLKEQQHG